MSRDAREIAREMSESIEPYLYAPGMDTLIAELIEPLIAAAIEKDRAEARAELDEVSAAARSALAQAESSLSAALDAMRNARETLLGFGQFLPGQRINKAGAILDAALSSLSSGKEENT